MSTTFPTSVRAQGRPSAYQPHYRLTRRGRLVVLALAVLAALALGVVFAQGSVAKDQEVTETIVVAPGDTLWDIASERADGDVRAMMHHIEELNGLGSVVLDAGQELIVPVE